MFSVSNFVCPLPLSHSLFADQTHIIASIFDEKKHHKFAKQHSKTINKQRTRNQWPFVYKTNRILSQVSFYFEGVGVFYCIYIWKRRGLSDLLRVCLGPWQGPNRAWARRRWTEMKQWWTHRWCVAISGILNGSTKCVFHCEKHLLHRKLLHSIRPEWRSPAVKSENA